MAEVLLIILLSRIHLVPQCPQFFFLPCHPQTKTTCCPTTKQNSVKSRLACAVKVTPVRTTTTARTGGAAHTSTNTGVASRCEEKNWNICRSYSITWIIKHCCVLAFDCVRALPCPAVKQSEEWGDPSKCEGAEGCQYCHTRTEQQFHPEVCRLNTTENATASFLMCSVLYYIVSCSQIYKSTKCNDMQQCGSCPRGPFCAFAHVESKFPFQNSFYPAASEEVTCWISSFHLQNRLFKTNLPSPRRAPRLPPDSPIRSRRRRLQAPADSAWRPGLLAPRLRIPSRTAQGRMQRNRGCWETSRLSVRTWVEGRSPCRRGLLAREATAGPPASRGRTRWECTWREEAAAW